MTRAQEPLEELVDALIYAPIGIVLDVVERYPEYVSRGRRQVEVFEKLGSAVLRGFGFGGPPPARGSAAPAHDQTPPDAPASLGGDPISIDAETAFVDADLALVAEVAETSSVLVDQDLDAILGGTVGEVTAAIDRLPAPVVEDLIGLEQAGKNRVTVLRAANKRLDDLREDEPEDAR